MVVKARLSECRVRSVQKPYVITVKPPAEKDAPDALSVSDAAHHDVDGIGLNFISATVSLYFTPEGDSKKGRALHIGLKPTGIKQPSTWKRLMHGWPRCLCLPWG
ncbi:MAG: hypothetical protein IPK34_08540 [Ramlibacter sp.]|nr:hypothetical protein [Ramlibacter sp.]